MSDNNNPLGFRMMGNIESPEEPAETAEAPAEAAVADAPQEVLPPRMMTMEVAMNIEEWLDDDARTVLRSFEVEDRKIFGQHMETLQREHVFFMSSPDQTTQDKHRENIQRVLSQLLSLGTQGQQVMYNTVLSVFGAIIAVAGKMAVVAFIEDMTDGRMSDRFGRFTRT